MENVEHKETYKKWKTLVNMSRGELEKFYNSQEGKDAGLSSQEASEQGISSGRESARWIMKMKDTNVSDWTPSMWRWAKKQISFISRMSGNKGPLYDDKGNKTRKHTSLLIWGNNPEKYSEGGLIAPNRKPSNLTPEQYRLVRTSAFKNWFGDWEKSYETGNYDTVSKVIDEETKEPLVVWHGTESKFFVFNPMLEGSRTGRKRRKGGIYFSSKKEAAETFISKYKKDEYGFEVKDGYVLPCFLNFRNVKVIDGEGKNIEWVHKDIQQTGYDYDIIIKNTYDNVGYEAILSDIFITINSFQIKLADGSNTTFDGNNPDIRFADGGSLTFYRGEGEDESTMEFLDQSKAELALIRFDQDGGTKTLLKRTAKYEFVGLDAEIEDYPLEDFYDNSDYYELIEEGEYEEVISTQEDNKDQLLNKEKVKAADILAEVIRYFEKKYPINESGGLHFRKSYYFIVPIYGTDKSLEMRLSNHSSNPNNIETKSNIKLKSEIVRKGNPKEIDTSDENLYEVDNTTSDIGFRTYHQVRPKNRVALLSNIIFYQDNNTKGKFDKTDYAYFETEYDLSKTSYTTEDIIEEIENEIEEIIKNNKDNVQKFNTGGLLNSFQQLANKYNNG